MASDSTRLSTDAGSLMCFEGDEYEVSAPVPTQTPLVPKPSFVAIPIPTVPAATPEPTTTPTTTPTAIPTPIPTPAPQPLAPSDLDPWFEQYGQEYGVSPSVLKIIARCESSFNAGVISRNGLYGGLYQYLASTWSSTRRQMGLDENPDLRFNAEEAIRTTAYKIAQGGIGAWPHCGQKAMLKQAP
jgi:soluble lytic murein transglycosylase-like protein